MAVYIKAGGSWRLCADGSLKIKAGGAWQTPTYCHIRWAGAWRDSGYRGYPNAPSGLYVTSWNFSTVNFAWSAPAAGGAPTTAYQIQKLNSAGTQVDFDEIPSSTTVWAVAVSQDEYFQLQVRSKSAAGLVSGWTNLVRVKVGHAEQGHMQSVAQEREWSNAVGFQSGIHRDEWAVVGVPGSVRMHTWRYILWLNFSASYLSAVPGPNNRQIYHIFNAGQVGEHFSWSVPSIDTYEAFPYTPGLDGLWGIIPRGLGWTPVGNDAQMLQGALYIYGVETYYVDQWVVDVPYQGNDYW